MRLATALSTAALMLVPGSATGPAPLAAAAQEVRTVRAVALDDAYELVFFAVLEGLYHDGVTTEVVDALLEQDEASGYPRHFVWTCPLCTPALNAFLVYRGRPAIAGLKIPRDTFGAGLDAELEARCLGANRDERHEALNALVERWIERRMTALRLTADERETWRARFEIMRKEGMGNLAGLHAGGAYAALKHCAVCDGANDALVPR